VVVEKYWRRPALVLLVVCLLAACELWSADPNRSTEVELSSDLSPAQAAAVHNAVLEVNAAVGREVFHVRGEHAGYAGHVTVTTESPACDGCDAETKLRPLAARIRLGKESRSRVVAHELLHTILGGASEHSRDPVDLFYRKVCPNAYLTDATLSRIHALMEEP
jgi:hypothetical protein